MRRVPGLLVSVLILLPSVAAPSDRYDPRLRFHTIATPRFDIHYHQGEAEEARRLAALAETIATELDATLGPASGRVQVVLVDQSDLSNGWATPVPFNTIEITAAAPGAASTIGNTSDWLRMVFTHEYTHIVHLSRGRGWARRLRRVFGRMPLLYPNLFLPIWQIEGVATYAESAMTGEGRVRDTSFRRILDVAASEARFEPLDRVSGGLVDWPAGHAPYLYGAHFHQFLRDTYGDDSLRRLTDATAGRVPYLGSRAFNKVFDRSLGELWADFERASRRAVPGFDPSMRRLTRHGFNVSGPRFGPDGRVYYAILTPHGFPAIYSVDEAGGMPRRLTDRYLGDRIGFAGSRLVFDEIEIENQVGRQSDLYAVSLDGSSRVRLTRGARAADPDVSPEGQTIVCTIQRADRRDLATLRLPAGGNTSAIRTLVSEPRQHFDAPRWSPDGRVIAAERGRGEIVLIDPVAGRVLEVVPASIGGRSISPAWTPDGALLFASDREGGGFRVYRTNVRTHETWRLEGTGPDARFAELSPDGRTLVFLGYTADGHDLFSIAADSARWTPVQNVTLPPSPSASTVGAAPEGTSSTGRPYSPWPTLAPRFWIPVAETDNDELVLGAATVSSDALGRHAYLAQAGWSTARGRPDWQVEYAYDRWRPTLFGSAADDTDPWRDGEIRTREFNAGALVPFRRIRWTQSLLGALHSSTDRARCTGCPTGDITRRSVRGGWRMNASRSYGYSISPEEGWSAVTSTELTREGFGSDGNAGAAILDLRGYVPVAPRHGVVAVRAAVASSWGDDRARRLFSASGQGPQPGGFRFGSDAVGLVRGLDENEALGRHAAVANVDYRFPVARIDRGAGTLPVFARVLHGAVFIDAGHAWDVRFRLRDGRVSAGAELSLDAVVGYVLPVTLTAGTAWVSGGRGLTAFGRIGRAF
jgi:Tol biopolymer transport system component